MSDDQAVKPPGDIGDGDARAPMEPASVSRVDGQLVVRVPMSAQGYLPERGYHYIRDANYVAFSRENVLGGWDTASPGLRFDDNDQLAVATALLDTQGAVVKDTQGEECVVSGRMVRLMLTHAARTAIENDCHPRVKCGERIVNICPLNLMLPHITDTDIVTVRKASVLFRNDGDADLWVPIVRFDAPAATVIMFCDRWMAQTAGTAQEPLITLFSVEAFVSANRTRGVSVPKPIEPDPHSVNWPCARAQWAVGGPTTLDEVEHDDGTIVTTMSTLRTPPRDAPPQGTIFRIPDPMGGLMGSRYGTRPAGPIQRQALPPRPETPAVPVPPPDVEKTPRARHAGPSLDTVRGRVLLVVGLMTHRRRTAGGRRDVAPMRKSDLPSLSREDLAVECWRIYGAPFAMQRHDYPNVIATTSKITELIASGMLTCRAQGEVSLSRQGWRWWRRVMRENCGLQVPEDSGLFDRVVSSGDAPRG